MIYWEKLFQIILFILLNKLTERINTDFGGAGLGIGLLVEVKANWFGTWSW